VKAIVIGGTGTVGSQVVRELVARKVDVTVLTRKAEKQGTLPPGVRGVVGDLLDPATVRSVFRGMDAVFLLTALGTSEANEGLMGVNGVRMAGVKRIVFLSVHNVDKAPHLPHFGAKLPIELAIQASKIPFTILRPNNFYQNDAWFKDALVQYGVYPQPIGSVGLSRVDVRDIAEVAAHALTTGQLDGQTVNLVGPDVLTGPGTAAIWSKALGRTIAYAGDDMDAWEKQTLQYMPAFAAFDFRLMYEFFQREGLKATREDIERQTKILGKAPRKYEDYVRETVEAWSRSASGVTA
jgi:uncharacterized protein YbjT (DUF2867 family)